MKDVILNVPHELGLNRNGTWPAIGVFHNLKYRARFLGALDSHQSLPFRHVISGNPSDIESIYTKIDGLFSPCCMLRFKRTIQNG